MKTIITKITMIMVIAAAVAGEARVYGPGEKRALRSAEMDVVQATGPFEGAANVRLTLSKEDREQTPSSLVLSYVKKDSLLPYVTRFSIIGIQDIGCGSIQYIARSVYVGANGMELFLKDHTRRTCQDALLAEWEATVSIYSGAVVFNMDLRGNPKPVFTPQSLDSKVTAPQFPVLSATMIKKSAHGYFENVDDVSITLNASMISMDRPNGLTVSFVNPQTGETVTKELAITQTRQLSCGSVQYIANLEQPEFMYLPVDQDIHARFSVVLVDHTNRFCRDLKPFQWEASVREGYGFCGTMDATMELVGNPQPVLQLQN